MFRLLGRRALLVSRFSTKVDAASAATDAAAARPKVVSSVPAGTVLKGCNVRKNGEDPVALKDEEYPEWLWEVLDPEIQKAKLAANPLLAARKARREANRQKIKEHNFLAKLR